MSGRDMVFMVMGVLVAIALSGLGDFISRVDTYSKVDRIVSDLTNSYMDIRTQVDYGKSQAGAALGMAREAIDKYERLQNQVDSTNKQIAELRTMYNDLKTIYYNQGQSTYSYPHTNY